MERQTLNFMYNKIAAYFLFVVYNPHAVYSLCLVKGHPDNLSNPADHRFSLV